MNGKILIGVGISAVFLWIAARDVDFSRAWTYVQSVNVLLLVPYFAVVFAGVVLRAWKWQVLLAPIGRFSFKNLYSATLIGLMANNVLPGRAGEFVRAYMGSRVERISFSTCFATVVIDRVLDGLVVSVIFFLAVLTQPLPDQVKLGGYGAAAIYAVALAFLVVLLVHEALAFRVLDVVLRPRSGRMRERVLWLVHSFIGGLGALRSVSLLCQSFFITFLIWLSYGLSLYIMALAMGLSLTLPQALVVLLIVTILLTLPSSPGYLGAMELGIKLGLQLFGVDESQAFAFALVYHITQYVPITAAGLIALWLQRFSISDLARVPRLDTAQPAA